MEDSQRLSLSESVAHEAWFASRIAHHSDAPAQELVPDDILVLKQRALQAVFDSPQGSAQLKQVLRGYVIKLGVARGQEAQELALDLYSELYVVAIRIAAKFDLSRAPIPWLLRIGYNLVLRLRDEQMRRRKHEAPLADLMLPEKDESTADAEAFDRLAAFSSRRGEPVTPLEAQHAASELLDLVSEDDRKVLELAVIAGLSGEALAQHLGIQPPAARQRLHRAINRLRVAYEHYINAASEVRRG